jgi:hypothetical protein
MNSHHAAALALVGWYLILPPYVKGEGVHISAPFSEWEIVASFDTAEECRPQRDTYQKIKPWEEPETKNIDPTTQAEAKAVWEQQVAKAICIASDDPRLKEK